ncbi:hypothetical protein L226DRAFT_560225 [Lentinus tigrinus ALCF2SS1-7]|uniref:uncharacterized protein n=1 Tax=Lentinus tigrinus ALCF2SS1-7 TaxID=1328758 RepID=UPI0011660E79|nr:hypothetical protein L226DRAFT_560225 [Lentinus tigrinus ALCF2SS1-7]
MKLVITALTAFFILQTSSLPTPKPDPELETRQSCDNLNLVPLLRAYSSKQTDHFYTTDVEEMQHAIAKDTYRSEGNEALVLFDPVPGSVALYRLWSKTFTDHFYTTSESERDAAIAGGKYDFEGITAWVFPTQACGSVPLYRLVNEVIEDHFYTTDATERDEVIAHNGYIDQGVAGYVYLAP